MLRDGVYQILYSGSAYQARGVFVYRNGAFIGVGQSGAIYEGTYRSEPGNAIVRFDGCVRFPPGTELVTGPIAGAEGMVIPFKGSALAPAPDASFSISLDGQSVDLQMTFVSPIPG
jgi:hypothetical protein